MTNQTDEIIVPRRALHAYERALTFTVAMSIFLMLSPELLSEGWLNLTMGAASDAASGLASSLAPLWRVLIGAFVVFPLQEGGNIASNGLIELQRTEPLIQFAVSVIFTWMLPFLDPPYSMVRWAHSRSGFLPLILKRAGMFLFYGASLMAAFFIVAQAMYAGFFIAQNVLVSTGVVASAPRPSAVTTVNIVSITCAIILFAFLAVRMRWRRGDESRLLVMQGRAAELPEDIALAVRERAADKPT